MNRQEAAQEQKLRNYFHGLADYACSMELCSRSACTGICSAAHFSYQVVFKRYELKYLLLPEQKDKVLRAMEPYMAPGPS